MENENQRTFSKGQWVLFIIIIPVLFALTIGLIVLSFAGVNVFEKAQELGKGIPFVSEQQGNGEKEEMIDPEELVALQGQVKERDTQIDRLENTIFEKEQSIVELEQEIEQQSIIIEELREVQKSNKREFNEVVSSFESMSSKNAAPILIEMDEFVALQVLSQIDEETLAKILEEMPPEEAAKFAQKLTVFVPNE